LKLEKVTLGPPKPLSGEAYEPVKPACAFHVFH
jgi:hypothetical protein